MRESKIEAHLVTRVRQLGGEVRKVKWLGRNGAPDRLVLLEGWCGGTNTGHIPPRQVWVELKKEGGLATFPKDAHERAQHREHERMREFGCHVEVIDSIEGVENLLK